MQHTREIVVRPPPFRILGIYSKDRKTFGARVRVDTPRGPVHFEVTVALPEAVEHLARVTFDTLVKRLAGKMLRGVDSAGGWNPLKRIRKMAAAVRNAAISTANKAIGQLPAPLRPMLEKPLQAVASATDPATYTAAVKSAVNKLGTTSIPGTNLSIRSLSKFGTLPFVAAKAVASAARKTIRMLPPEARALATGNPLAALSKAGQRLNIPGASYLSNLDPTNAAATLAAKLGVPGSSLISSIARARQGDVSSLVPMLEAAPEVLGKAEQALAAAPDVLATVQNLTGSIVANVIEHPEARRRMVHAYLARKAAHAAGEYTNDAGAMKRAGVATVLVSKDESARARQLVSILQGVGKGEPKAIAVLSKLRDEAAKGSKGAREAWHLAARISNAARLADARDTARGALTISHGGRKGALTITHDAAGDGTGDHYGVAGMIPPVSPSHALLAGSY